LPRIAVEKEAALLLGTGRHIVDSHLSLLDLPAVAAERAGNLHFRCGLAAQVTGLETDQVVLAAVEDTVRLDDDIRRRMAAPDALVEQVAQRSQHQQQSQKGDHPLPERRLAVWIRHAVAALLGHGY